MPGGQYIEMEGEQHPIHAGCCSFATVLSNVVEGVHGAIHSCDTFSLGT